MDQYDILEVFRQKRKQLAIIVKMKTRGTPAIESFG